MKRNEAKLELFYILERLNSHPEANSSIAEEMLTKLEEIGMLPPTILKEVPNYEVSDVDVLKKSICLFEHGIKFSTVNEWEPEDEA